MTQRKTELLLTLFLQAAFHRGAEAPIAPRRAAADEALGEVPASSPRQTARLQSRSFGVEGEAEEEEEGELAAERLAALQSLVRHPLHTQKRRRRNSRHRRRRKKQVRRENRAVVRPHGSVRHAKAEHTTD